MANTYELKDLLVELDKLDKEYNDTFKDATTEYMWTGIDPDPKKGSGMAKLKQKLSKIVKDKSPLVVSRDLKNFVGSISSDIDENNEYFSDWLNYIDEEDIPADKDYLEWRGAKGKALSELSNNMANALKSEAAIDTAYGINEILQDLKDEARTTDEGGLMSILKRAPGYLLSAFALGAIGGGLGETIGKSDESIGVGAGSGVALGLLLNYIRRKNKYGGAVNV